MLQSILCDYSNVYILDKRTTTVANTTAAAAVANTANKKVTFKNCAPFTDCMSK